MLWISDEIRNHGIDTIEQTPHNLLPKLFSEIRERYADRPGGYTRILRIEPLKTDQAASAILELVDGPKDMRFAMTARTLAKLKKDGNEINEMTRMNIKKVTRFRKGGHRQLNEMVARMRGLEVGERDKEALQEVERNGQEEEVETQGR